jgi:hypothetical protein
MLIAGLLTGFRLTADLQTSYADVSSAKVGGGAQQRSDSSVHLHSLNSDDDCQSQREVVEANDRDCESGFSDESRSTDESDDQGDDLNESGSELIDSDSQSGQDSDVTEGTSEEDDPDTSRYSSKRVSAPLVATEKSSAFKSRPCEREDDGVPNKRRKSRKDRAPTVGSSSSAKAIKAAAKGYKIKVVKEGVKHSKKKLTKKKQPAIKVSNKGRH